MDVQHSRPSRTRPFSASRRRSERFGRVATAASPEQFKTRSKIRSLTARPVARSSILCYSEPPWAPGGISNVGPRFSGPSRHWNRLQADKRQCTMSKCKVSLVILLSVVRIHISRQLKRVSSSDRRHCIRPGTTHQWSQHLRVLHLPLIGQRMWLFASLKIISYTEDLHKLCEFESLKYFRADF